MGIRTSLHASRAGATELIIIGDGGVNSLCGALTRREPAVWTSGDDKISF